MGKNSKSNPLGDIVAMEIMKTSIPNQLALLYGLANSMDILRIAIDDQLRDIYARYSKGMGMKKHGFSEGDLRGLTNYTRAAKAMAIGFSKDMEHMVQTATSDEEGVDVELYDTFMSDSNWLVRLMMYATDRFNSDPSLLERIMAIPKPERSVFPDELIERKFNMKQL